MRVCESKETISSTSYKYCIGLRGVDPDSGQIVVAASPALRTVKWKVPTEAQMRFIGNNNVPIQALTFYFSLSSPEYY